MTATEASLAETFQTKFSEFCSDLKGAVPELTKAIESAESLAPEVRMDRFVAEVLPACPPSRDVTKNPGLILPGVVLPDSIWAELGDANRETIQKYVTVLSMCCLFKNGIPDAKAWMDDFMKTWQSKMSSVDFEGIAKKLGDLFKTTDASGANPFGAFGSVPERLLKGHLGKLIEEITRDFKPEDLGLDEETVRTMEASPTRAFELITELYTKNPQFLQNAMKKIMKRLQAKFQSGEIRPEQIAAEAEELMKTITDNPVFAELLEQLKSTFGMADMDIARKAGKEESARLSLVKDRLRKKLEAKKAGKK